MRKHLDSGIEPPRTEPDWWGGICLEPVGLGIRQHGVEHGVDFPPERRPIKVQLGHLALKLKLKLENIL